VFFRHPTAILEYIIIFSFKDNSFAVLIELNERSNLANLPFFIGRTFLEAFKTTSHLTGFRFSSHNFLNITQTSTVA